MKKLRFSSEKLFNKDKKAGYNGWANYPTWYLNMYLIEDEDSERLEGFVKDVLAEYEGDYPEVALAEALEDRAREYSLVLDNVPSGSLSESLIEYALGQVDYTELGHHLYKLAQERGWLTEDDEEEDDE